MERHYPLAVFGLVMLLLCVLDMVLGELSWRALVGSHIGAVPFCVAMVRMHAALHSRDTGYRARRTQDERE